MYLVHSRSVGRPLLILAALLLLTACETLRVGSDHDPAADFSRYHSFAWMAPHSHRHQSPNPLVVQRAHDAIQAALTGKGYTPVTDSAQADFIVDFTIGSRERTDVRSYPAPYGGALMWGGAYWWEAFLRSDRIVVHHDRRPT
jgi:hypothetical protein